MHTFPTTAMRWAACVIVAAMPAFCRGQLFAPPVVGEAMPNPLTLKDLENMALRQNPTLAQARAQVQMSQGKALQAGLRPNPRVGYLGEQIGAEGSAGEMQGMFFEQDIVTGGKLKLSRSKFTQEARQAELQVTAQCYRVLHGIRVGFYETAIWQRRVELRHQLLANAQEAELTVRELVNVGQANQSDALRAAVELECARVDARRAQRRLEGSWEALAAVAGMPDVAYAQLDDRIDFMGTEPLNRRAALDDLLILSPELEFARAEVVRDQIALERERVEPIPNVSVRAESGYNFESDNTVAGVEVGFRLPLFDKNQGTILQAEAELARAQAEVCRVELVLRRRFAEVFADYESSHQVAEVYRTDILPKAEVVYQSSRDSFKNHRMAWPQVVDAQREYLELFETYLDNLLAARRAETRLESFLLDDGLSQPPQPEPEGHRDSTPKPR